MIWPGETGPVGSGSALRRRGGAIGAGAAELDDRLAGGKTGRAYPGVETLADLLIGKLGDVSAYVADREGRHAVAVVVRLATGDEGVHALQPVHEAGIDQTVERAVDL